MVVRSPGSDLEGVANLRRGSLIEVEDLDSVGKRKFTGWSLKRIR